MAKPVSIFERSAAASDAWAGPGARCVSARAALLAPDPPDEILSPDLGQPSRKDLVGGVRGEQGGRDGLG